MNLEVMTFNIRNPSDPPPRSWPERLPLVAGLINDRAPDVVGVQEAMWGQVKSLARALPGYDWLGLGRDGGSRGEFMAVYWRRDKFELEAFDHFWLSATPELIASATWGNTCRRMVTTASFGSAEGGFEFWNTHFDHQSAEAKLNSARLVVERAAAVPAATPFVLVGDFNALGGASPAWETLVARGPFRDVWLEAAERGPDWDTWHNWQGPSATGRRIDWILTRGPLTALRAEVIHPGDGPPPSDHCPLTATLRLG